MCITKHIPFFKGFLLIIAIIGLFTITLIGCQPKEEPPAPTPENEEAPIVEDVVESIPAGTVIDFSYRGKLSETKPIDIDTGSEPPTVPYTHPDGSVTQEEVTATSDIGLQVEFSRDDVIRESTLIVRGLVEDDYELHAIRQETSGDARWYIDYRISIQDAYLSDTDRKTITVRTISSGPTLNGYPRFILQGGLEFEAGDECVLFLRPVDSYARLGKEAGCYSPVSLVEGVFILDDDGAFRNYLSYKTLELDELTLN